MQWTLTITTAVLAAVCVSSCLAVNAGLRIAITSKGLAYSKDCTIIICLYYVCRYIATYTCIIHIIEPVSLYLAPKLFSGAEQDRKPIILVNQTRMHDMLLQA